MSRSPSDLGPGTLLRVKGFRTWLNGRAHRGPIGLIEPLDIMTVAAAGDGFAIPIRSLSDAHVGDIVMLLDVFITSLNNCRVTILHDNRAWIVSSTFSAEEFWDAFELLVSMEECE